MTKREAVVLNYINLMIAEGKVPAIVPLHKNRLIRLFEMPGMVLKLMKGSN
jgi:hypothetical protein